MATYYARLYYNANGGSGSTSGYSEGWEDEPDLLARVEVRGGTPSRTYYTFNGWSFSSTATSGYSNGSYVNLRVSSTPGGYNSYTIYATWTHQTAYVNYYANGGSGAPAQQSHWAGYSVTLSSTVPTRSGYTFLGWSTSSTATTASYQPGNSYALYTTTNLYAVWKLATYTVSYNKGANGTGTNTSDTKTHGTALTLKGAIFTRTGYTQTGWSTSDGGAKAYNLSASYTTNAAITLYPFWTANTYIVSYDKGANGTGTNMTDTKTHDVPLVLQNALFTRANYEQTGWSLTDGGEEEYDLGETYTANAAITLYPFWTFTTPTYTITYNANGGSGAPASQTKIQDEEIYLSSTTPTLGSCAFLGWATSKANAKNRIIAYAAGDPYTTNANLILYAVWDTDSIVFRKTAAVNKNLFNVNNYQHMVTEYEVIDSSYRVSSIQLEPNTTYTVSKQASTANSSIIILINNAQHVNGSGMYDLRVATASSKQFTTDSTGKLYIGEVYGTDESCYERLLEVKVQIEQGTTHTDYEPYEPFPNKMKLAFVHVKKNGNMVHSSVFVKSENGTMVKV